MRAPMNLRSLMSDLRYAVRQLSRARGFSATVIAVLALGLGGNIAVFTVINGVILRPIPYADPDRIAVVQAKSPMPFFAMTYGNMVQLSNSGSKPIDMGMSIASKHASVVGPGGRMQLSHATVTANLFRIFGVDPVLGRNFLPNENDPGRNRVVLLGDDVWKSLYRSDPSVVGKTITLDGQAYSIIGVMPPSFSFPFGEAMHIWSPEEIKPEAKNSFNYDLAAFGSVFARIPTGSTPAQLADQLSRAQQRIAQQNPKLDLFKAVEVTPYQRSLNDSVRKPLFLLYAVVFAIWALACLNVTSLMLTRAVSRSRELAVRAALGAARSRLMQQTLIQSLLLSVLGALAGFLIGESAIKLLWHAIDNNLPLTRTIHVDTRVVLCLAALTLLTAVFVGIAPALRASRISPQDDMRGIAATASAGQTRTREALVVAQLALTVVFLVGAGLLLRTIQELRAVPLGFAQQNVLTGGISRGASGNLDNGNSGQVNIVRTTWMPLIERLRALPGVQSVALSSVLPMRPEFAVGIATKLDHKEVPFDQAPRGAGRFASPGLVDVLGIPMVLGRFFTDDDSASAPPVVVVNQAFAKKYLPNQDPIGHTISMGKGRFDDTRIVGVIGDMKQYSVQNPTTPEIYFCLNQAEPGSPLYGIATAFMEVAIRASIPADQLRGQFDRVLHEISPDATTTEVKTMHEAVEDSFSSQAIIAQLLEAFAALALLIAAVGLYGLLSFAVAQRTREIGVRMALGATRSNVLQLILKRAGLLVSFGLCLGLCSSWFAASLAQSYVFGVHVHDATTFVVVAIILATASLSSAWLPARRAASVEPMQALRNE